MSQPRDRRHVLIAGLSRGHSGSRGKGAWEKSVNWDFVVATTSKTLRMTTIDNFYPSRVLKSTGLHLRQGREIKRKNDMAGDKHCGETFYGIRFSARVERRSNSLRLLANRGFTR